MVASLLLSALLTAPPELQSHVDTFVADSKGLVRHEYIIGDMSFKPLEYSEKGSGVIGLCYMPMPPFDPTLKIEIDPKWWSGASDIMKKQLMYHELAHCVCFEDHKLPTEAIWIEKLLNNMGIRTKRRGSLPDGCEDSIMYEYVNSDRCVEKHWDTYVEDVFKSCHPNHLAYVWKREKPR